METERLKEKILVVDDEPAAIDMLRTPLENEGFHVFVAQNGQKAIKRSLQASPDLILLDVMLPDMHGFETCRRLKADKSTCEIPVIFMTVLATNENKIAGFQAGAVDYVTKPVQIDEVLARVRTHVALYKTQRQIEAQNLLLHQEISERKQAEEKVCRLKDDLEQRVEKRTAELGQTNRQLEQEIAERKQIEAALRESEEKYRVLVNNLPGIVCKGFKDWSVEFFDDKIERLTGFSMDRFNSGKINWMDLILKDDIEPVKQSFIQSLKTDKSYVRDYRIQTKAKDIVWIQEKGYIVCNQKGDIDHVSAVFYDITDRKKAEEAVKESEERFRELYRETRQREQLYESLLTSAPDAVAIYNLDEEAVFINPAFTHIFGYTIQDVQGKRIPFVPESEADKTMATIEKVLQGEPVSSFETKRLTKDGSVLDVSASCACYLGPKGKAAGIIVFLRDITEIKQFERQLYHSQKMEAVGTLASSIAHDFNNLLQTIQGYAELMLFDWDEDKRPDRKLREIIQITHTGSELTQQLLTFGRKVESKKKFLNLNTEIKTAMKLLERTIPKMIAIKLRLGEPLRMINADQTQLGQIIMNLVINAKDAMPEGGELTIETGNTSLDEQFCQTHLGAKPGEYVFLSVCDTGQGMDKMTIERIFEPFFTTKQVGQGTGLGLAIVYGIVKDHGGYIGCRSAPGKGTTFDIYFPVAEKKETANKKRITSPPKGGTETILLVDDEKSFRMLGKTLLEKYGYKVLTAADGESALDLYCRGKDRIDLVILDWIIPGMGGRRCLEELLKADRQAKVLIASGYSDRDQIKDAFQTGAKDFISKPFEISSMLNVIRQILDED